LIQVHYRLHRFILPHYLSSQPRLKIPGFYAALAWVEL